MATRRDAPALAQLLHERATAEGRSSTVTPDDLLAHLFSSEPKANLLVAQIQMLDTGSAKQGPCLSGFALWGYELDLETACSQIRIKDLHLRPDERGKGTALAMFKVLARRALADGCSTVTWSKRAACAPGIRLYQSLTSIPLAALTTRSMSGDMLAAFAG